MGFPPLAIREVVPSLTLSVMEILALSDLYVCTAISTSCIWSGRTTHVTITLRYATTAAGNERNGIMQQRVNAGGMIWTLVVQPCSKVHSAGIGRTIIWIT
jgi:hypothetical protein